MQSLPLQELEAIAPRQLRNYRVRRYRGDDFCSSLQDFAEPDQRRIRKLYGVLCELFDLLKSSREQQEFSTSQKRCEEFERFLRHLDVDRFAAEIRELGIASINGNPPPMLSRTLHDIRGGGLTSLIGNLQLAAFAGVDESLLTTVFYLTRDHLKIMRNALTGLDDERRNADLELKLHSIHLLVEKWSQARLFTPEHQPVPVSIDSHFDGNISECCVEFGALDRVLYNLLNNAGRHTSDGGVSVVLLPVPSLQEANDLRFVVLNQVSATDLERLHAISGGSDDLRQIFTPGVSTTGSGLGLSIVADLVANAYGLPDRVETLGDRYLGARLVGNTFAAWFHWPLSHEV